MHSAAFSPRGGVARRAAQLRGQSIIEYVLIIAIIGLVIVFAGPGVAGAIRNQFNLVGNTVNNGTSAGTEGGGASGGGSAGGGSATVQAAIAKDAKDWSLGEQEAVAEDIAAKGEASPAFAKAKAAMDAGTKFTMKLTDGKTLEYRIVGINHDDLADGSGKAGLTFEATNGALGEQCMDTKDISAGGWKEANLRQKMNSGEIWNLMPSDFQSKVKAVTKMTYNKGGSNAGTPSSTTDKVFLLSMNEIYGDFLQDGIRYADGTQYEYYKSKGVTRSNNSGASSNFFHWTRTERALYGNTFFYLYSSAYSDCADPKNSTFYVFPAWCF